MTLLFVEAIEFQHSGAMLGACEVRVLNMASVVFSPDGKRLAAGYDDMIILHWDTSLKLEVQKLGGADLSSLFVMLTGIHSLPSRCLILLTNWDLGDYIYIRVLI